MIYGLASFYCKFIKDFSSIMISLIECIKKDSFKWTKAAQRAFELIKAKFWSTFILAPSNFKLLFVIECDANRVGIGAVLTKPPTL